MHDFGDFCQRRILRHELPEQRLEGARVAGMRVLRLEHVEAELTFDVYIALRIDEPELRTRVDEPADEPRARDAVDVDVSPRDPRLAIELGLHPAHAVGRAALTNGLLDL